MEVKTIKELFEKLKNDGNVRCSIEEGWYLYLLDPRSIKHERECCYYELRGFISGLCSLSYITLDELQLLYNDLNSIFFIE